LRPADRRANALYGHLKADLYLNGLKNDEGILVLL
jgi:hypothetical protein